jgi:hypothetical protein
MSADLEAELRGISPHQLVDHVGIERFFEPAGAVIPDRPEQRSVLVRAVAGRLEIVVDVFVGPWAAANTGSSRPCRYH